MANSIPNPNQRQTSTTLISKNLPTQYNIFANLVGEDFCHSKESFLSNNTNKTFELCGQAAKVLKEQCVTRTFYLLQQLLGGII
mmetsp:Transcript_25584/g.37967  ORF Transcript_25584/g.37967 Transcript_25584/m.37967 type:complete len:84 (+) Transcript_25584:1-252(+)